MPITTISGHDIHVDDEGFMTRYDEWSEPLGKALAAQIGIEMTDEHWKAIRFLRSDFPEQGETATLTSGAAAPTNVVPTDLPLSARLLFLVEHQPIGSYLAVLERSPFWDAGVSGVEERGSFHFVLGWPGGQP